MDWLIWENGWLWNNNFSKTEARNLKIEKIRELPYDAARKKKANLKIKSKKTSLIRTLKNTHPTRLPFLKKKAYAKLWKKMKSNYPITSSRGYWDWKNDLYYQERDRAHPRFLWLSDKRRGPGNLVNGPVFFSNEEKRRMLNLWLAKKKSPRLYKAFRNLSSLSVFNDAGWQSDWTFRSKTIRKSVIGLLLLQAESKVFVDTRKKKTEEKRFLASAENKNFWGISWWKKRSSTRVELWNKYKFLNEELEYSHYIDVNSSVVKNKDVLNSFLIRSSAKFLLLFYKKTFKTLFFKKWEQLKCAKNLKGLKEAYMQFKSYYWLFFSGLKSFLLKTAVRPAARLLNNIAFSTIISDKVNLSLNNKAISFEIRHNVFDPSKTALGSSFLADVARYSSRAVFSNYFKINNYTLIRYFLYLFAKSIDFFPEGSSKKTVKFNNFFRFVSYCAEEKYTEFLNVESTAPSHLNKDSEKKKDNYRLLTFGLLVFQQFFLQALPVETFKHIWFSPVRALKERLMKIGPKLLNRGPFFYIRKKLPKWYKSRKSIRLFKKFVRNYCTKKKKAGFRLNTVAGQANRYFKMTSCKKYFKQKIFIRAKFIDHYRAPSRCKLNSRWKNIQKARHKWHGYYKEFEGNLLRASLWAGFSNKYKLSKFLVDNDLIFLNGSLPDYCGYNGRQPVKKNDILYLRKDIASNLFYKRELRLFKKYLAKYPFYNKLLKAKVLFRSSKILKGYLMGRPRYKRKHIHTNVVDFLKKEYLSKADAPRGKGIFEANQPNVELLHRKIMWHKKVKNVSSFKFVHNVLNKKSEISSWAGYSEDPRSENFLLKSKNSVMLSSLPISVNNFYYGTDFKIKKMISPRTVKYFSERRFNY